MDMDGGWDTTLHFLNDMDTDMAVLNFFFFSLDYSELMKSSLFTFLANIFLQWGEKNYKIEHTTISHFH